MQGESQMETHIPMKKDAIFRLASMTKPIATLALLRVQVMEAKQLSIEL